MYKRENVQTRHIIIVLTGRPCSLLWQHGAPFVPEEKKRHSKALYFNISYNYVYIAMDIRGYMTFFLPIVDTVLNDLFTQMFY